MKRTFTLFVLMISFHGVAKGDVDTKLFQLLNGKMETELKALAGVLAKQRAGKVAHRDDFMCQNALTLSLIVATAFYKLQASQLGPAAKLNTVKVILSESPKVPEKAEAAMRFLQREHESGRAAQLLLMANADGQYDLALPGLPRGWTTAVMAPRPAEGMRTGQLAIYSPRCQFIFPLDQPFAMFAESLGQKK